MKISQRVVLSLFVAMLQLMTFLWACDKINIQWVIVMLWAICISLCKSITFNKQSKFTFNSILSDVSIIYSIVSMISMSAVCYQYPTAESWNSWCHLEFLLFPNLKKMIEAILDEMFQFSLFFFRLAQHVWNEISQHMWHYAKIIGLVGISVLIFLYLIDLIAIKCISFTDSALKSGVKHSDSGSLIYPKRYGRQEYEQGHSMHYIVGATETLLVKQKHFITQNTYQPLVYERYNGEDIQLVCYFDLDIGHSRQLKYYWNLHGVRLYESDKRIMKKTITAGCDKMLSMTLTISRIDDEDYGMYGCVEESVQSLSSDQTYRTDCNVMSTHGIHVDTVVQMKIHLKRQKPFVEVVHLSPDNIALFLGYEFLTTDDSWVLYDYTINGVSFNSSFTEIAKCSKYILILDLLNEFLKEPYHLLTALNSEYINDIEREHFIQQSTSQYITNIRFCSSPNIFGWHKLRYLRERFNTRINRTELVEYPNPTIRLVLPEPKRSVLFSIFDDTELYQKSETEILAKGYLKDIDKYYLSVFKSSELKVRLIHDCIFTVFLIIVLAILPQIPRLYCIWFYKPMLNRLLPLNKQSSYCVSNHANKTSDVFVAHSDEDYSWVSKVLFPRLEDNLGLTICLPDRDFHQGEAIISATERALNDSKIILICLTDSYLNEPGCYRLQIEHLVLPNLYEKERPNYKIVVLNFREETIPQPLRWNPDIVVIHRKSLPETEFLKELDKVVKQCICEVSQNNTGTISLTGLKRHSKDSAHS